MAFSVTRHGGGAASVCVKLRNGECIKAEPVRCRGCILLTGIACTFPPYCSQALHVHFRLQLPFHNHPP
jgi:hypothetical protein